MEKLKNEEVSQEQPVHDEEHPIHLVDLYHRLMVSVLKKEVDTLNQTINIYKGFNWNMVTTQKQQQDSLNDMKSKIDELILENEQLKRVNNNLKCTAVIAEQFLKGDSNVDKLTRALYSGNILDFLSGAVDKKPVAIPDLNELSKEIMQRER